MICGIVASGINTIRNALLDWVLGVEEQFEFQGTTDPRP